jgi:phage shock protein PspC (stress-responsive transcriptional regulator)
MKNLNIGIRPTILTIFTLIVFLTLTITLGLQYYFSQSLALDSVKENMAKQPLALILR